MEKKPYRSVKEAVALYGQRILAPDLYANVLQQMENEEIEHEHNLMKIKSVKDELDIAKQNLERSKERSVAMARSLSTLQEEVEETKRKLQTFKERSNYYDIEFIGDSWKNSKTQSQRFEEEEEDKDKDSEIHGKKHMVVNAKSGGFKINNNPSMKIKPCKKKSILFMKGIFSKKK